MNFWNLVKGQGKIIDSNTEEFDHSEFQLKK